MVVLLLVCRPYLRCGVMWWVERRRYSVLERVKATSNIWRVAIDEADVGRETELWTGWVPGSPFLEAGFWTRQAVTDTVLAGHSAALISSIHLGDIHVSFNAHGNRTKFHVLGEGKRTEYFTTFIHLI